MFCTTKPAVSNFSCSKCKFTLNTEFFLYSNQKFSCLIEHIKLMFSMFDLTKFSRIKSINNFPLIVNKALGMPSDKGRNLVASPPTKRYISLIIIQNI